MSWNPNAGSSNWPLYSPSGQSLQNGGYYPQNTLQPHYANAYYHAQQGLAIPQPTQINVPGPGFSRNQPMVSLVPLHMRNRCGPVRCGHEGCLFSGTNKEVEIHKMDRHLIFPPGWEDKQPGRGKRKRDGGDDYVDEEAQFRANGGGAILGTDMKLDSPEAIAAWLADRKKRWPSAKRIADKTQSRQEALERGQILTEPPRPYRLATNERPNQCDQSQRGRGRGRERGVHPSQPNGRDWDSGSSQPTTGDYGWSGRGRGRGRGGHSGRPERGRGGTRGRGGVTQHPAPGLGNTTVRANRDPDPLDSTSSSSDSDSDSASDSDDSGSDVDPLNDAISSKIAPPETAIAKDEVQGESKGAEVIEALRAPASANAHSNRQTVRRGPSQPPKPAYIPFNQRSNLLRNLLVPDIQATVSNLSQAIRFLVANDFLENVELKPGDAEDVQIQPMDIDTT